MYIYCVLLYEYIAHTLYIDFKCREKTLEMRKYETHTMTKS